MAAPPPPPQQAPAPAPPGARFAVEAVRVGATRSAGTVAFTGRRLAALAAHHHVLVLDPAADGVHACLGGHTDRVVGVCWLQPPAAPDAEAEELVSCSVDGSVRVWALGPATPEAMGRPWRCAGVLEGHSGPVTAVAAHALPGGAALVVSAGLDCTLRGWVRRAAQGGWAPLAPHALRPTSLLHALAVTTLPGVVAAAAAGDLASSGALVAAGGVDGRVHLFTLIGEAPGAGYAAATAAAAASGATGAPCGGGGSGGGGFVERLSLAGHLDWVRCLSFSHHSRLAVAAAVTAAVPSTLSVAEQAHEARHQQQQPPHVMLASGSNDGKVRLWRLSLAAASAAEGAGGSSEAPLAARGAPSSSDSAAAAAAAVRGGEDDDEADDEASGDAATGDAVFDAAVQERGSLLVAASFLQHHAAMAARHDDPQAATEAASANTPVTGGLLTSAGAAVSSLATLQRPKAFSVRIDAAALGSPAGAPLAALALAAAAPAASTVTLTYEATFDALLAGHDGWVTSVTWRAPVRVVAADRGGAGGVEDGGTSCCWWQPPCLVTASMDRTIALWQPSGATGSTPASPLEQRGEAMADGAQGGLREDGLSEAHAWAGVWEPSRRIGGAGGAGGLMGLYSGSLSPDGSCLMAHSHNGAVHTWLDTAPAPAATGGAASPSKRAAVAAVFKQQWKPAPSPTGHFGAVTDISWGTAGAYAVSTSADATTRVWAPYAAVVCDDRSLATGASSCDPAVRGPSHQQRRWCELGRPQIHGYEMAAAAVPPIARLPHRLFSYGDEKVARVFDAPRQFLAALAAVSGPLLVAEGRLVDPAPCARSDAGGGARGPPSIGPTPISDTDDALAPHRAAFAYVSELALTNKGIAPDSVGVRIADRFQLDGRDAVAQPPGTGSAAAVDTPAPAPPISSADPATAPYLPVHSPPTVALTPPEEAPQRGRGLGELATPSSSPPPLEDDLVTHTRWPETDKLFSHPHEGVCVAVSGCGRLAATSCKARCADDAAITLWDTLTCRRHQVLPHGHKLTPVSLAWSHPTGAVVPMPSQEVRGVEGLLLQCAPAAAAGVRGASPNAPVLFWAPEQLPAAAAAAVASPADCDFLVSVGKDRQVALFARELTRHPSPGEERLQVPSDGSPSHSAALPLALAAAYRSPPTYRHLTSFTGHKRIIWAVSWAPLPCARSLLLPPLPPHPPLAPVTAGVGSCPQHVDVGASPAGGMPPTAALPPCALFATGARDHTCKLWLIVRRGLDRDVAGGAGAASAAAGHAARGDGAGDAAAGPSAVGGPAPAADHVPTELLLSTAAPSGGGVGDGPTACGTDARRERSAAAAVDDDGSGSALTLSAACTLPPFDSAVTAVAFAPVSAVATAPAEEDASLLTASTVPPLCSAGGGGGGGGGGVATTTTVWLAVGLESGRVSLWRVRGELGGAAGAAAAGGGRWVWTAAPVGSVPPAVGHAGAVRKLAWRPPVAPPATGASGGRGGPAPQLDLLLASAGDDHSVRFTRVVL
jgi:elongator complex protein 2